MLSEYDEHGSSDGDCCSVVIAGDIIVGESGNSASGVGETVDIDNVDNTTDAITLHANGDIVDEKIQQRASSTEPSTGFTPDDESPSLGTSINQFIYLYFIFRL